MASWMYISVCIIAALVVNTVEGVQLQALPTQIVIGGQNPTSLLKFTCRPTTPGLTSVLALEIGRRTPGGDNSQNRPIVQLVTAGQVDIKDTLGNRIESSAGSISGTSGNLEVTIKELQCSDAAVPYYCSATINTGTIQTVFHDVNITAISNPGPITMIATPNSVIYGNPPVLVDFTCTGLIGNQFDPNQQNNMANYWVWQWRTVDDFNSQWVRYPNSNNITYRTPTPASGSCQYNGGSTLLHTVTSLDNGRQFRCYVLREEYSDNKTVYTQEPGVTGQPGEIGGNDGDPQGANVGMIVGIVIGVLAVIVIVVVLVYFLVFRRKSGGDDYDTGEGKEDRPPMTGNVVYSTPASREKRGYDKKDSNANAEGLHYADLDLTKLPMNEDPDVRPKDTPTEYASIKLFP